MSHDGELPLSKVAGHLFARVSSECPASITAQAASIALDCQQNRRNPKHLLTALLADKGQLAIIENAAEAAHRNLGEKPNVKDLLPGIIQAGFQRAEEYFDLPEEVLRQITTEIYPTYHQKTESDKGEAKIRQAVFNLIRESGCIGVD